mgnify:CR=1 FL=1
MKEKLKTLGKIFMSFIKIGLFTFGSGYAMITLIKKEMVDKHHWLTDEEVLEIVTIAESTPGSITINVATFVGRKIAGLAGALIATAGVILPSFVLIVSIFKVMERFSENIYVRNAFSGIKIAVIALIIKAFTVMFKAMDKNIFSLIIMFLTFVAILIFNVDVFTVIIVSGLCGVIYHYALGRSN